MPEPTPASVPGTEPKNVCVSVPGKAILMGEHAAVYCQPAVVAGLDLRTTAQVCLAGLAAQSSETRVSSSDAVELQLPDLDTFVTLRWQDIDRVRKEAFHQSECYLLGHGDFIGLEELKPIAGVPPVALFVAAALGEASAALAATFDATWVKKARASVGSVRITSQAPLGAGCGSSAAVATATVAAFSEAVRRVMQHQGLLSQHLRDRVLGQHDLDRDGSSQRRSNLELHEDAVEAMALRVEHFQHGRPSGVDTAAVLRGGVLRAQRASGKLTLEPVRPAKGVMAGFSVVMTGQPAETTGTVVDAVGKAHRQDRDAFQQRFAGLGALSEQLVEALRHNHVDKIGPILRAGQRFLEQLAVVPAPVRELVRHIESCGAYAKISGAGSLSGSGAGILLVYDPHSNIDSRKLSCGFPNIVPLTASLGAEGLRYSKVDHLTVD